VLCRLVAFTLSKDQWCTICHLFSVTFYVLCAVFVLTMLGSMAEVYRSYLEHKRKHYDDRAPTSMVWPSGEDSSTYKDSLVNSNIQKTAYTDVSWHRITNTV